MPGTFAYTESTNKIVVTAGTSGAPATFNDMYTADQAGTGTVLNVAENGAAAVALDYAVRPTYSKAIQVKCIVAAKTAEADFIFITGTDWRGAAQTESIDVTAGNGPYTTTKYWATITNLDCSDNAAGGGNVWADGTIAVTQDIWGVVWEHVADAQYKIDCHLDIGDDSTATYFQSALELVHFADDMEVKVKSGNAYCELGDLSGDWGIRGSAWSIDTDTANGITDICSGVTAHFYMYASTLINRGTGGDSIRFFYGHTDVRNSHILFNKSVAGGTPRLYARSLSSLIMKDVYISDCFSGFVVYINPDTFEDVHIHSASLYGIWGRANCTVDGVRLTGMGNADIYTIGNITFNVKDPKEAISTVVILSEGDTIYEQYTCNVHVTDREGNNLSGVTVKCVETGDAGATVFSVSTAANGTITEQTINYKKWITTSETLTTYSPHEFYFMKAGYKTYKIKNITVDDPIIWEIKLDRCPYSNILGIE